MFKEYDVNTKQEKKKKINIHIPKQKFDFYTDKKCDAMNPKSPGCKV